MKQNNNRVCTSSISHRRYLTSDCFFSLEMIVYSIEQIEFLVFIIRSLRLSHLHIHSITFSHTSTLIWNQCIDDIVFRTEFECIYILTAITVNQISFLRETAFLGSIPLILLECQILEFNSNRCSSMPHFAAYIFLHRTHLICSSLWIESIFWRTVNCQERTMFTLKKF